MNNLRTLKTISLLSFVALLLLSTTAYAQERGNKEARPSPNAMVSQTIGTNVVTITYGRPSVKGRQIFGGLQPWGEVWRTGANEATIIQLPSDVTVQGKALKAGNYSIHSIPGKDKWTVIFNSNLGWGIPYDANKEVMRVETTPEQASKMEQLLIYFTDVTNTSATINVWWDTTRIPFSIEI